MIWPIFCCSYIISLQAQLSLIDNGISLTLLAGGERRGFFIDAPSDGSAVRCHARISGVCVDVFLLQLLLQQTIYHVATNYRSILLSCVWFIAAGVTC